MTEAFVFLSSWLLADFLTGLVHWWEDRAIVGASRFKFINGVRADNERHHDMPGWFLRYSWWGNINTTAPFALSLSLILFITGAPVIMWLTTLFLSFGNLVHRWAHEPPGKLPRVITLLQRTGILLSYHHHAEHHFDPMSGRLLSRERSYRRYCVMTSWLNPILDGIGFFNFLNRVFRV
jgi:hypothetical protein